VVLRARSAALSFPSANPRHEHEWKIWKDVALPAGKIIIPGVIDSTSNFVEGLHVYGDHRAESVQGQVGEHGVRALRHVRTVELQDESRVDDGLVVLCFIRYYRGLAGGPKKSFKIAAVVICSTPVPSKSRSLDQSGAWS